ncbi:MAG: efflux RND transporter periplasmic adaptor subunit [Deltaproteobacteria bacterium]|nr:efflux RND transporter periplasmic adaptor subunit [Deltaproteobacteria bacterium]
MLFRSTIFITALVIGGCPRQAPESDKAEPLVIVSADNLVTVTRERIERGPALSGSLEAREKAVLRAEIGGSVVDVDAELGDPTRPGQVLARIEAKSLREALSSSWAAVVSAQEEAALARRQLDRSARLAAAGAIARHDQEVAAAALAAASARLEDTRARWALARQQLDTATVRAPFAGVVSERAVNAGDVVAPGTVLFSIIDPSTMRLTAQVSSEAVGELAKGKRVSFNVRGYPEQVFTGTIARIAPAADEATRQIKVLVELPNPGHQLIAGLFAEGRVAVDAHDALVVPLDAVDLTGATPTVMRIEQDDGGEAVVDEVTVATGLIDERSERVEILSGVRAGDRLLIGAARSLAPGTRVELAPAAGADVAALVTH